MALATLQTARDISLIRVLYIEDDPADAFLVGEIFNDAREPHVELAHASYLSEAMIELICSRYDAILLDLQLPDANGFQSLQKIPVVAPNTPLIVVTETGTPELRSRAFHAGAWDFVPKHRMQKELLPAVFRHTLGDGWSL